MRSEIDMALSETDWRHFDNLYAEKQVSIIEEHEQKKRTIESCIVVPMHIGGAQHLREVTHMERLNMLVEEIRRYAKESVTAFIDAFIEVHSEIDLHPADKDVEAFRQRLYPIPERCIEGVEEYYKSIYSPIPNKVVADRIFDLLHEELRGYPSLFSPKLNRFLTHSARRKERGLPLNNPTQTINNSLNISGDLNAPAQVGTSESAQAVIESTGQNELSKENAVEAGAKIAEYLTAKDIWKGEWVYFKDIAEATGVEVWVVKECIDYAAMVAYLKIGSRLPGSVLLVRSWGGLG
jgi:hypothetical protein